MIDSPLSYSRCDDPDGEILDDCWVAELPEIAKSRTDLEHFFPDPAYSTLQIYVAGKKTGPNEIARSVATQAIDTIDEHLHLLDTRFGVPSPDWHFTTIWVPYQTVSIFFVRFWSDYGVDLDHAIKLDDCRYGVRGVLSPTNTTDSSVASVPGTVRYLMAELAANLRETDPDFNRLRLQVREEQIMGVEILASIVKIVNGHRNSLPLSDHYLTLLGYVQHHSTGG